MLSVDEALYSVEHSFVSFLFDHDNPSRVML